MVKTIVGVEGMMCHNCERHVNKAVEANFDVKNVTSDFEAKQTVIESEAALDPEKLKAVIGEEGYEVTSVQEA